MRSGTISANQSCFKMFHERRGRLVSSMWCQAMATSNGETLEVFQFLRIRNVICGEVPVTMAVKA